jgi:hypothetical protein
MHLSDGGSAAVSLTAGHVLAEENGRHTGRSLELRKFTLEPIYRPSPLGGSLAAPATPSVPHPSECLLLRLHPGEVGIGDEVGCLLGDWA